MIIHLSIKVCERSHINFNKEQKSFFDIYERKFKHLIEAQTDQIQGLNKCYINPDKAHQDTGFAEFLFTALMSMFDESLYNAKDRLNKLR